MQALTVAPKPGMSNACTEIGKSLVHGALAKVLPAFTPARRSSRDVPAEVYALSIQQRASVSTSGQHDAATDPAPQRHTREKRPSASGVAEAQATVPEQELKGSEIDELAHIVACKHQRFMDNLNARSSKLALVQTSWERGHLPGCLQAIKRGQDVCLAADMLKHLSEGTHRTHFKVDMCGLMVPSIGACLKCHTEPITSAGLKFFMILLQGFEPTIMEAMHASTNDPRDLGAADRRQRMSEAHAALSSLDKVLEDVLKRNGKLQGLAQAALDVIQRMRV
jgi:hypothetical protein